MEVSSTRLVRASHNEKMVFNPYQILETVQSINWKTKLKIVLYRNLCKLYIFSFFRAKTAGKDSTAPFFPVETLKQYVMSGLRDAVIKGAAHIRDPIGGSSANLFV